MFCWLRCAWSGWWRKSFGFPLIFHDYYNQLLLTDHAISCTTYVLIYYWANTFLWFFANLLAVLLVSSFVFCWLVRCALPAWWRKSFGFPLIFHDYYNQLLLTGDATSWSTFAHFYCFRLTFHAFLHWLWTLLLIVFCCVELHDSGLWRKSFGFPLIFHD